MVKQILGALLLACSCVGNGAFADDHDNFPEGTLLALEGSDAISKEECLLFVTDVGFTGPEKTADQWYATVQTSYNHGGATAAPFTVKIHPTKPGVVLGAGANGQDEIAIFLDPQDLDLRNAKSFNLKWFHVNHFHTNRCDNMQVHED